jgi:hypothetical protein
MDGRDTIETASTEAAPLAPDTGLGLAVCS